MVSPDAGLTDVRSLKGGTSVSVGGQNYKANFTACSLNSRASCRVNCLRCEASLFEDRECPIFYGHGNKIDMVLFLLVGTDQNCW